MISHPQDCNILGFRHHTRVFTIADAPCCFPGLWLHTSGNNKQETDLEMCHILLLSYKWASSGTPVTGKHQT